MKNSNVFWILLVALVLAAAYIFLVINQIKDNAPRKDAIEQKIDSLEACIEIKQHAIDSINQRTKSLTDSIARIDTDLKRYKTQLQEVRNKYAKIKPTDNATPADVSSFFSERYGK